jgi:preprotein translocase subunit SecF
MLQVYAFWYGDRPAFIAAILTVIGYSMNDTVIVFDRVREFLDGKTKEHFMKSLISRLIQLCQEQSILQQR